MAALEREREKQNFLGKSFIKKSNSDNNTKAQSAMEYLMTYGWAILIIAVILAALDFLGVFNTGTFIGPSCLATPGYLCSNPVMTANANGPNLLSFNFEQDTGQPIYEVSFACAASSNSSTGLPTANTANVFQFATSVMSSGSSLNISGMQCYGSNANLFQDHSIGTVFSGTLWIRYTTVPASTNYQYAKVARITAKVESEAASITQEVTYTSFNTVTNTIPVGSYPQGVAFAPNGAFAYVTNFGSNTVSVINTSTNTVTNTIPVRLLYPHGVAFAPSGAFAYVTNYYNETVSVINTSTNTVTNTIPVGIDPCGVAFNPSGAFAYVANYGSGNISVINTSTNTVTSSISVGLGPYGVAIAPSGAFAYVTNYGSSTVSVLSVG